MTVVFGLLMLRVAGYGFETTWLRYKLMIVALVFLPLEAINLFLVLKMKTFEDYERYDKFILYITPVLIVAGLVVVYMAVFKIN